MWIRALFSIIAGAYVGGLIASYAILAMDGASLQNPMLRVLPFYFSLGIMFFTVPGALIMAGLFEHLRQRGRTAATAYSIAVLVGTVIGGIALGTLFRSLPTIGVGSAYGFATSTSWAMIHALAFRGKPNFDTAKSNLAT